MAYNYNRRLSYPFYGNMNANMLGVARFLRNNQIVAEKFLWKHLRKRSLTGCKFRRQHPVYKFVTDFYCNEAKLVIEVDGGIHEDPVQALYDKMREAELERLGIFILRFTNKEIIENTGKVIEKIKEVLCTRLSG